MLDFFLKQDISNLSEAFSAISIVALIFSPLIIVMLFKGINKFLEKLNRRLDDGYKG